MTLLDRLLAISHDTPVISVEMALVLVIVIAAALIRAEKDKPR